MPNRFANGVKYYTSATLTVHFPEDLVVCAECPLYKLTQTGHPACRVTGSYVYAPNDMIGEFCPLKFTKENVKDEGTEIPYTQTE